MAKIITVTVNTAIDKLVTASSAGKSSLSSCSFAAGKGINVARTVAELGEPVVALGFVGQSEVEFFQALATEKLTIDLIPVAGSTRINTTTFDPRTNSTKHERTAGFTISSECVVQLLHSIGDVVAPGDYVIISGSIPVGARADMYQEIIDLCHARDANVILDSSGEELRFGIKSQPFMIKPNLEELEELAGKQFDPTDEAAIVEAGMQILADVELVIVSRGQLGVIVVSRDSDPAIKASVSLDRPPMATGSVGSGDALVGGIAVGLKWKKPVDDTIRLGVACGAANVISLGPGVCRFDDVQRLLDRVSINSVQVTDEI